MSDSIDNTKEPVNDLLQKPQFNPEPDTSVSDASQPDDNVDESIEEPAVVPATVSLAESSYAERQYLRFGARIDRPFLDTEGALSYLETHGFGNNNLTQARAKIKEAKYYEGIISKVKENAHYCDFCGKELGVEFDVLSDGRERCNDCSRTIVHDVEELSEIFVEIERNMEVMFSINYFTSIDVKFVDSKKIARQFNEVFVPTSARDPRTLGFAEDRNGAYSIWVENQSPYLSCVATIAHELTHIWQYLNWDRAQIKKTYAVLKNKYPKLNPELIIYEGMAKWVEIQYLLFINEYQRALIAIDSTIQRPDEYGVGFKLFYKEYGLTRGTFPQGPTPFMDKKYPLHEY